MAIHVLKTISSPSIRRNAIPVEAAHRIAVTSEEEIEMVADDADLEEVYNTERHLLYVA